MIARSVLSEINQMKRAEPDSQAIFIVIVAFIQEKQKGEEIKMEININVVTMLLLHRNKLTHN